MMQNITQHSLKQMQPALGTVAYWSATPFSLNTNDRTSEITAGSQEGSGYA
jgi:hypothetical protein